MIIIIDVENSFVETLVIIIFLIEQQFSMISEEINYILM